MLTITLPDGRSVTSLRTVPAGDARAQYGSRSPGTNGCRTGRGDRVENDYADWLRQALKEIEAPEDHLERLGLA